jgi:hypothetical protein
MGTQYERSMMSWHVCYGSRASHLSLAWTIIVVLLALCPPVSAIEIEPTRTHIDAALEQGRSAARDRIPPDHLYAWFGSSQDLEPRGFLMTKIIGLRVMAAHFALRGEHPSESEIRSILNEPALLVSATLYGDHSTFAVDSYMLLVQQQQIIKPTKVRFDGQANRTSVWPASPRYQAKIVASFAYAEIDPRAQTRISVFPASGGEFSFDIDFATID